MEKAWVKVLHENSLSPNHISPKLETFKLVPYLGISTQRSGDCFSNSLPNFLHFCGLKQCLEVNQGVTGNLQVGKKEKEARNDPGSV